MPRNCCTRRSIRTGNAGPGVGDGVPGVKEAFEEAYDAAGGASFLGLPSADAYEAGPGVVQHLRGARCGHPAVICAISGREAVVVTADLWNGIARIGNGRPGGGVHGVGFPVHTTGGDQRYIGPYRRPGTDRGRFLAGGHHAPHRRRPVDLDRGSGVRPEQRRQRRHRLQLAVGAGSAAAAGRADPVHSGGAAADCGGPTSPDRRTGQAGHDRDRGRTGRRPDRGATELQWRPRSEQFAHNDSWGASYDCLIHAADGRPAIRGTLQFLMPDLMRSQQLTSIVDIEFDFDGCQTEPCQPNTPVTQRVSHLEIADFFTTAWSLAFNVLPLALGEPAADGDPGDRPRAGLYIINERGQNTGGERTFRLGDLVDLAPFGTTHKTYLSRLDIGIVGRGSLPEHDARDVVRQALIRAAENAGFDAADLVTW